MQHTQETHNWLERRENMGRTKLCQRSGLSSRKLFKNEKYSETHANVFDGPYHTTYIYTNIKYMNIIYIHAHKNKLQL